MTDLVRLEAAARRFIVAERDSEDEDDAEISMREALAAEPPQEWTENKACRCVPGPDGGKCPCLCLCHSPGGIPFHKESGLTQQDRASEKATLEVTRVSLKLARYCVDEVSTLAKQGNIACALTEIHAAGRAEREAEVRVILEGEGKAMASKWGTKSTVMKHVASILAKMSDGASVEPTQDSAPGDVARYIVIAEKMCFELDQKGAVWAARITPEVIASALANVHAAGRAEMVVEVRAIVQAQVDESNRLSLENPDFYLLHEERADDFQELLTKLPETP